ncbi:MAG: DMT family transporter [Betaproteobacteria bacterium]|nr:DMT family transporter [Betaproteobacteria bacterium]
MTPEVAVAAWLWIPITIWAAFAQTVRNAAQRSLTPELGTLGATLVRFLYGLPFAGAWLWAVQAWTGQPIPAPNAAFWAWVCVGGVSQIAATALLLRAMQERNFTLGVAYSKTEILQVAVIALVFLGDPITLATGAAVLAGTLGVLLLSPADKERPFGAMLSGWTTRTSLLGIASGTAFALSAVGFRGATMALPGADFLVGAAATLVTAQLVQSALLGGWLAAREPSVIAKVARAWRGSLLAGFMGAAASVGWFTALALAPAAHVRTLGLVELVFTYALSLKLFREKLTRLELTGMALLLASVVTITLAR